MEIQLLFFGACREAMGQSEVRYTLATPATVADVWAQLLREHEALRPLAKTVLFAVNETHSSPQQQLQTNDTLAIFPPVAGG